MSTGVSFAIVFSLLVGVVIAGERFQPKYDITSTLLICTGSIMTVLLANKS
jgi:flagellar motor component MotA